MRRFSNKGLFVCCACSSVLCLQSENAGSHHVVCRARAQEALAAQNASYAPGAAPLSGAVTVGGGGAGAGAVTLDLNGVAERLWAVELASLHRAAADAASEERRRCAPRWPHAPCAPPRKACAACATAVQAGQNDPASVLRAGVLHRFAVQVELMAGGCAQQRPGAGARGRAGAAARHAGQPAGAARQPWRRRCARRRGRRLPGCRRRGRARRGCRGVQRPVRRRLSRWLRRPGWWGGFMGLVGCLSAGCARWGAWQLGRQVCWTACWECVTGRWLLFFRAGT